MFMLIHPSRGHYDNKRGKYVYHILVALGCDYVTIDTLTLFFLNC